MDVSYQWPCREDDDKPVEWGCPREAYFRGSMTRRTEAVAFLVACGSSSFLRPRKESCGVLKWGKPPNHPFFMGIYPIINHPFWLPGLSETLMVSEATPQAHLSNIGRSPCSAFGVWPHTPARWARCKDRAATASPESRHLG